MGVFFAYILRSAICLVLFYLGYRLLLNRDTFHRFNRYALLSGFVLAALLPFVRLARGTPIALGTLQLAALHFPFRVRHAEQAGVDSGARAGPYPNGSHLGSAFHGVILVVAMVQPRRLATPEGVAIGA